MARNRAHLRPWCPRAQEAGSKGSEGWACFPISKKNYGLKCLCLLYIFSLSSCLEWTHSGKRLPTHSVHPQASAIPSYGDTSSLCSQNPKSVPKLGHNVSAMSPDVCLRLLEGKDSGLHSQFQRIQVHGLSQCLLDEPMCQWTWKGDKSRDLTVLHCSVHPLSTGRGSRPLQTPKDIQPFV